MVESGDKHHQTNKTNKDIKTSKQEKGHLFYKTGLTSPPVIDVHV
jgi:hypothetical protein